MSNPGPTKPTARMKRTLGKCLLVVLALAPVLVVGDPAGAQTRSVACGLVDSSIFDGPYFQAGASGQYFAGEQITATAGEPVESSAPTTITLSVGGIVVDTASFPGTVSYTFPADINTTAGWEVDTTSDATWTVSCQPAPPLLPTTRDQCKRGGYEALGFENQGDCVRFVATGA